MSQVINFGGGTFPPGAVVETLTGNSGGPVFPDAAGNINVLGGVAGRNLNTVGNLSANTLNVQMNNDITLGDLASIIGSTAIGLASGDITIAQGNVNLPTTTADGLQGIITVDADNFIHSFGVTNTFVGSNAGNLSLTGFSSVAIGYQALQSLTSGAFNTTGGFLSQQAVDTGDHNASWGSGSLFSLTSGSENSAFGNSTLDNLVSGDGNIALGYLSGNAYTTNESNNIVIANSGIVGESNVTRIGDVQTSCYITGIANVDLNVAEVVTMDTATDQLGSATLTAGSGITITPGANVITISATGADLLAYTSVNTSPYVALSTDEYLGVDSSGGAITVQLPNAPSTGRVYYIKDSTGSADTFNITVTTVGGVVNIDGATTYVMNTEYQSANFIFNGSAWEIF